MTDADKPRLAALLAMLGDMFDRAVTAVTAEAYQMALSDMPIEAVERAVARHLREGKFFPRPGELRDSDGQPGLTREERAMTAWNEATRAAQSCGSYGSPSFEDPAITAVILDMGGWVEFCLTEQPEHFVRKDFTSRWVIYDKRRGHFEKALPPHLVGLHEANNRDAFPEFVPRQLRVPQTLGRGEMRQIGKDIDPDKLLGESDEP